MRHNNNALKKLFWMILFAFFLLTAGQLSASSAGVVPSGLIITEFIAANGNGLVDEDGDYSDWIEIYNRSNAPINLTGWALTNNPNQPQQWRFPDMTLENDDYLVVFASGKNRNTLGPGAMLHTNFKLSKNGDFLALHNLLEGRFMDTIEPQYPEQFRDVSYGRYGAELTYGYLSNPTPARPNDETLFWAGAVDQIEFSVERGLYKEPFTVELTAKTPESTIYYTVDGSKPNADHGTIYTEPITLDRTTVLRAIALKANFLPSTVNTQSYIFFDDVASQLKDPVSLLASVSTQNTSLQQGIEIIATTVGYETSDIDLDNPSTIDLPESLQSIPSLSLVTTENDMDGLLNTDQELGINLEYPVSVELIETEGSRQPGFQIDAGIKRQDILEATDTTVKQSLQISFKGKYGATKLQYPLFSDSTITMFDTLMLQAGNKVSGANQDYIRNQWLRTSQIEMSNIGTHGKFVHLYLNGNYWGLYNLAENPDEDFMASYLGGEKEDWFVANQDGPLASNPSPQASQLDDLFTALALFSRLNLNTSQLEQSENMVGIYPAIASYFTSAQFIDFIILNGYAYSQEWPTNNWYASVRLQDQIGRGKIIIADEQKTTIENPEDNRDGSIKALFNASMQNPDFRMQFADRLYKHLFNNGALSDVHAQERWSTLEQDVSKALVAETVRWQDNASAQDPRSNPNAVVQLTGQVERMIDMAREAGYYPDIDPPTFNQEGGLVESGFILTLAAPETLCPECLIYYTTDGTDPRMPITEAVFPTAKKYTKPLVLTTTTRLKARIWAGFGNKGLGDNWSALHEVTFNVLKQDNKLRLTEIMYNPTGGDDYEFVELQNTGTNPVDLANFSLDEAVRFTFPPNTPLLAPGEFAVLVSNADTFTQLYPDVTISGTYEGHLSNKGEKVILRDTAGEVFIEVEYNDEYGWPVTADGRGDSIILFDEYGNPNNPKSWRASSQLNGSPGAS